MSALPIPIGVSETAEQMINPTMSATIVDVNGFGTTQRGYVVVQCPVGLERHNLACDLFYGPLGGQSTGHLKISEVAYASGQHAVQIPAVALLSTRVAGSTLAAYRAICGFGTRVWESANVYSFATDFKIRDSRFLALEKRLNAFRSGVWDPQRGERPGQQVIDTARTVFARLEEEAVLPKKVVAADGEVLFYFSSGQSFTNLEFLSDGSVLIFHGRSGSAVERSSIVDLSKIEAVIDGIRANSD